MTHEESTVGPLQILLIGFETTERFHGEIAHQVRLLRGHGMIRVLDARMFHRAPEGKLTEIDLQQFFSDPPDNAIAHLIGANGGGGNGHKPPAEAFSRTAGFALEDLRRLTDEIGPGDHAAVILVEHLWSARVSEAVREAGGRLLGQGFLTQELMMIIGAEMRARADAEAALELAKALRGTRLVEALERFGGGAVGTPEDRARGAAKVVSTLVETGFIHEPDTEAAIEALVTSGLIESAIVDAAIAEAEEALGEGSPEAS